MYVNLCTELRVAGEPPLYWDDDAEDWSGDPDVACYIPPDGGPDPEPIERLLDQLVCPVLALVYPPEGDIPGVWDCPPYGNA